MNSSLPPLTTTMSPSSSPQMYAFIRFGCKVRYPENMHVLVDSLDDSSLGLRRQLLEFCLFKLYDSLMRLILSSMEFSKLDK